MATHVGGKKRVPSGGNDGKKGPFLCLLRVELLGVSPSIWRKLWVSNIMTLAHLHHILQAAMGWTDAHLHQFTIEGVRYGPPIRRTTTFWWMKGKPASEKFSPRDCLLNTSMISGTTGSIALP